MSDLEDQAGSLYKDLHGTDPAWVAQAPGRVNLIGEMVDFVGGLVLPAAIDRFVAMAGGPASEWSLHSETDGGLPLLRAIGAELQSGPVQAVAVSTVPGGAGLSSSAAFLVAAAAGMNPALDGKDAALRCQRAEQEATGAMVGIMDQFASALGRAGHALLINCASLEYRQVAFPEDLVIAVIDSGIRRELSKTPYNQRRQEAIDAVATATIPLLELEADQDSPRLRHVASELARVREFVPALEAGDRARLGQLLAESHRSLRDDFDCSLPAIDELVDKAAAVPGCVGARIMGGGFGGSVIALLELGAEERFSARFENPVFTCRTAEGAFTRS